MRTVHIVIVAKAPQQGFAKTRLIPKLGKAGAANLAEKLLKHAVMQAVQAKVGPVELCVTSEGDFTWGELNLPPSISWSCQGEGDLGARLEKICMRVINQGESVLLMGTDCPALNTRYIQRSAQALEYYDASIVPVSDGGYALLALNKYDASLFSDIPWSTNRVTILTRKRLSQLSWSLSISGELNDIDEPADLQWLPKHWHEHTAQ